MRPSLLILNRIQRCHFHGRDDVRQDFVASLIFRAPSSHCAQLHVFVFQLHNSPFSQCPAWPSWSPSFSRGGSCAAGQPPPTSCSQCRSQAGSRALAMRSSAANPASAACAGCLGAGSTDLPSSGEEPPSPAIYKLFTNDLQTPRIVCDKFSSEKGSQ